MSPNMPVSLLFRWTELIGTRFSTGIHGPQTMNPSSSGDLLTLFFLCQKKLKLLDVNKRLGDHLSFKSESPVPNAGRSFGLLVYLFCIILRRFYFFPVLLFRGIDPVSLQKESFLNLLDLFHISLC